jgi:hypothetical protein
MVYSVRQYIYKKRIIAILKTYLVQSIGIIKTKNQLFQAFFLKGKGNIHGISKWFTLGYT